MNASYRPTPEFEDLLARMCDGELTPTESRRLEEIVTLSDDDCDYYLRHVQLHGTLYWNIAQPTGGFALPMADEEDSRFRVHGAQVASGQWLVDSDPPSALRPQPSIIPPIVIDPSPTLHSPLGSFVFSHIAAAVILGIGLLIGLAWRISLPTSERQEPGSTGYASVMIGRITALADCQWHKQGSGERAASHPPSALRLPTFNKTIYLGDRLAVASGLMEITYNTGAKVILQGPCTYEIDSKRGGYLAVGKLTARVDKRTEGGRRRAENEDHYQLPTTNYQLFAVRTPTATVTDLGTEFGVEVEQSGATRSHVFQGSVSIVPSPNGRGVGGEGGVVLSVGDSARVERGRGNKIIISREPGQPGQFVRHISKSTHLQISKSTSSSLIPHPLSLAFRLTDLGTLGGRNSRAQAINAKGQVVGKADTADGAVRAFLYSDRTMKDIGVGYDGDSSANGINVRGQIVGSMSNRHTGASNAFLYSDAVVRKMGTLGGANACAYAIADTGMVVGVSRNAAEVRRAFLYKPSVGMKDLGSLGGSQASSSAMDVNAAGQVTGYSDTRAGAIHAFRYDNHHGMEDLGTAGGVGSFGCRINDNGQVVGGCLFGNRISRACVFGNGTHYLGTLGGRTSTAFGINKAGLIVGDAEVNDGGTAVAHAFLYRDGQMQDLNRLVDLPSGWVLTRAVAVNDVGQITGYGTAPDGNERAFLLTPIQGSGARDQGPGIGGQGLEVSKITGN